MGIIKSIDKANELLLVMTVCRHGVRSGVMVYVLQTAESTIHIIFITWVVLMETIFSRVNLKSDDGFLPYSMPEVFIKTDEHGFTYTITD